jgi:uncharacterized protein (TIGR03790 family)
MRTVIYRFLVLVVLVVVNGREGGLAGSGRDPLLEPQAKTRLRAPGSVSGRALSSTEAVLTWVDTNVSETGYQVQRRDRSTGTLSLVGSAPQNGTRVTISGLPVGSTQYFQVVAVQVIDDRRSRTSEPSPLVAVTLPGGEAVDTVAPTAPGDLSAVAVSSSQIQMSWFGSTDTGGSGLVGYRVFRDGNRAGNVAATATTFVDSGLSAQTSYTYTVVAVDGAGNVSESSNAASATTQPAARAATSSLSDRVLVVYNEAYPESLEVANYYRARRGIPASNACAINVANRSWVDLATYESAIKNPIRECLNAVGKDNILYVVLSYATPDVAADSFAIFGYRSVDQLIIDVWDQLGTNASGYVGNPYYAHAASSANIYPTFVSFADYRRSGSARLIYSVWRLDGSSATVAKGLVDKAIIAEGQSLGAASGIGCFDRIYGDINLQADSGYGAGEWDLHQAARLASQAGFTVIEDDNGAEFGTAPAPPRCDNALLYAGWYSYGNYNDAFSFANGAIGWHLDSYSWVWSRAALDRGITVTSGVVSEPFLEGLTHPDGTFRNLLNGANVGDAFLRNTNWVRWMVVNWGDPLYRPFPVR